jgi:hypothetical protein
VRDAILTAGGAALVAALNELRAWLRARQADRDRIRLVAAAVAAQAPEELLGRTQGPGSRSRCGCGGDEIS